MSEQVSVSREVAAPAETVWSMVSDLTRMGEWSPENSGARWLGKDSGPALGARFRGTNRRGSRRWTTVGRITAFEPGRLLAFRVSAVGLPVSEWRYEFRSTAGGCVVTETWVDERGRIARALGKPVSGVDDRLAHNRAGMETTLDRLKAAAEG